MNFFNLFKKEPRIKDEDLLKVAKIEYKKDYMVAYNWMKANPGKNPEIGEFR
jgi:hypothetical protein